jgi:hypothetical protein
MRNSTLQDSFSAIYFSQTGNVVATGSWGSMNDTNPTVNVFSAQTGKIVGSFNTPGSVFDIAVVEKGNTIVVAAGGKSVHANTMGRGGNLFSLSFNTPSIAFSESDFILDTLPRISVSSSWVAGRNSRFEGVTVREARRLLGTNIIPLPSVQSQSARSVDTISAIPDSFDSTKQWPTCSFPQCAVLQRLFFPTRCCCLVTFHQALPSDPFAIKANAVHVGLLLLVK